MKKCILVLLTLHFLFVASVAIAQPERMEVKVETKGDNIAVIGKARKANANLIITVEDINGKDLQLTPTFNLKTDQVYYLVVDSTTEELQIEAEAVSSKTMVLNTGFHGIAYGSNTIVITTMAENGDCREYIIIVVRQE